VNDLALCVNGAKVEFEVGMPLRWLRQHTVTVVFAIVVLLIWALVFYEIFID
jgi:hypothetical protein